MNIGDKVRWPLNHYATLAAGFKVQWQQGKVVAVGQGCVCVEVPQLTAHIPNLVVRNVDSVELVATHDCTQPQRD